MAGASQGVNIGIIDLDYQFTNPQFTLIIMNSGISAAGFLINVTYNLGSYILSGIKMAYLTVDPSFT